MCGDAIVSGVQQSVPVHDCWFQMDCFWSLQAGVWSKLQISTVCGSTLTGSCREMAEKGLLTKKVPPDESADQHCCQTPGQTRAEF